MYLWCCVACSSVRLSLPCAVVIHPPSPYSPPWSCDINLPTTSLPPYYLHPLSHSLDSLPSIDANFCNQNYNATSQDLHKTNPIIIPQSVASMYNCESNPSVAFNHNHEINPQTLELDTERLQFLQPNVSTSHPTSNSASSQNHRKGSPRMIGKFDSTHHLFACSSKYEFSHPLDRTDSFVQSDIKADRSNANCDKSMHVEKLDDFLKNDKENLDGRCKHRRSYLHTPYPLQLKLDALRDEFFKTECNTNREIEVEDHISLKFNLSKNCQLMDYFTF